MFIFEILFGLLGSMFGSSSESSGEYSGDGSEYGNYDGCSRRWTDNELAVRDNIEAGMGHYYEDDK